MLLQLFLLSSLAIPSFMYINYQYLKYKHNERLIESLKKLVPNKYSLEKEKIQEYVYDTINLLICSGETSLIKLN